MREILKKIKIWSCKLNLVNKLITDRSIRIHKKKLHQIEKFYDGRLKFYSPLDFKNLYKDQYDSCHIWGSGSTANSTKSFIKGRKDFFHIGFGFSCLLNIDFDFYFIENASKQNQNLLNAQNKALDKFINNKKTILVFKNLWQAKNDSDLAYETYKDKALFIRDLIIPHYNMSDTPLNNTINKLLDNDPHYFRGSCSTVITSILFAKFLGFKKIVLHGIDFYGDYFFDNNFYIKKYPELIPPHAKNVYDKKWRNKQKKHPTANCLELMIPKIKDKLIDNHNIQLFTSSKLSGSNKYLSSFFNE